MAGVGESIKITGDAATETGKNINALTKYIENYSNVNNALYRSLGSSTTAMQSFSETVKGLQGVIAGPFNILSELSDKLGGTGFAAGIKGTVSAFEGLTSFLGGELVQSGAAALAVLDSQSAGFRKLDKEYLAYTRSFGVGLDKARELSSSLSTERVSEFGKAFNMTAEEVSNFNASLLKTNIGLDTSFSNIEAGGMSMKFYSAAMAVAQASGMDASSAIRNLNDMISKQGMSAEAALEALAGYSDISKETGLNIDTVSNALVQSISGLQKMGTTIDFGKPILKGFAESFKEVGLGIEGASDAASSFTQSLARMSTDYAMSYILNQKGGMGGQPGGTILSSSIETRARMLEAGDDTGKQADIAVEMAKSLKESIESFTGSGLITLKEAAKDQSLQQTFYLQEQMISKFTGTTDVASLDRIMEMLPKIAKMEKSGDQEGAQQLAKSIQDAISQRDQLMGEGEKLGITLQNQVADQMNKTREVAESARDLAKEVIDLIGISKLEFSALSKGYNALGDEVFKPLIKGIQDGSLSREELSEKLEGLKVNMPSFINEKEGEEGKESDGMFDSLTKEFKSILEEKFPGGKIIVEMGPDLRRLIEINPPAGLTAVSSGT